MQSQQQLFDTHRTGRRLCRRPSNCRTAQNCVLLLPHGLALFSKRRPPDERRGAVHQSGMRDTSAQLAAVPSMPMPLLTVARITANPVRR